MIIIIIKESGPITQTQTKQNITPIEITDKTMPTPSFILQHFLELAFSNG